MFGLPGFADPYRQQQFGYNQQQGFQQPQQPARNQRDPKRPFSYLPFHVDSDSIVHIDSPGLNPNHGEDNTPTIDQEVQAHYPAQAHQAQGQQIQILHNPTPGEPQNYQQFTPGPTSGFQFQTQPQQQHQPSNIGANEPNLIRFGGFQQQFAGFQDQHQIITNQLQRNQQASDEKQRQFNDAQAARERERYNQIAQQQAVEQTNYANYQNQGANIQRDSHNNPGNVTQGGQRPTEVPFAVPQSNLLQFNPSYPRRGSFNTLRDIPAPHFNTPFLDPFGGPLSFPGYPPPPNFQAPLHFQNQGTPAGPQNQSGRPLSQSGHNPPQGGPTSQPSLKDSQPAQNRFDFAQAQAAQFENAQFNFLLRGGPFGFGPQFHPGFAGPAGPFPILGGFPHGPPSPLIHGLHGNFPGIHGIPGGPGGHGPFRFPPNLFHPPGFPF